MRLCRLVRTRQAASIYKWGVFLQEFVRISTGTAGFAKKQDQKTTGVKLLKFQY